ncbi:putative quinol monooxygenase [Marinobacterium aestuarii]|uniref:putative quinol monooxygenase n=1 Tax=Marinobacterium aestuarii TaxID=1821621 RepID=UPI0012FF77DA|nr:antibiotic biosynthesis monooxygenase [Marinobacterium aestuarii]
MQKPNTGGDLVVLEGWRDAAALQSHGASAHFQAFITAFSKDELQMSVQLLKTV